MKASASLPFLFLLAAACTDATTAPAGIAPSKSVSASAGNEPPPPIDAAVVVCTSGGCAVYEGTYMSSGGAAALTAAIKPAAQGEGVCTSTGQSWLQINESFEFGFFDAGESSANARLKCSHGRASGSGTIQVGVVVVDLDGVVLFDNPPDCTGICGEFIVHDEDGNEVASGEIIEREFFDDACDVGEGGVFCEDGGS
jgi:hypothetical protein